MTRNKLHLTLTSFSYKKGIPKDQSEHGGGFIFDCRAIHNPGRYEEYKDKTGKDSEVIAFFEKEESMHTFLYHIFALVDMSVETYLARNFEQLKVHFGCTGGQHRSVFAAEQLAAHLADKYAGQITFSLQHIEQEQLNIERL